MLENSDSVIDWIPSCSHSFEEASEPWSCDFYKTCVEAAFDCGSDGYPIKYGLKYCNAFADKLHLFDDKGKEWAENS